MRRRNTLLLVISPKFQKICFIWAHIAKTLFIIQRVYHVPSLQMAAINVNKLCNVCDETIINYAVPLHSKRIVHHQ